MEVTSNQFLRASERALQDPQIQANLRLLYPRFHLRRAEAVAQTPQWEELRQQGRAIKQHVLMNLDYYLELLERQVTAAGGRVFFASSAEEACRYIADLALQHRVRLVTKGKSMVSEEMGLNRVLEAQGIEVVETDLGEYILQLAHEPPFHIVAPAIHKSKAEVSELFARHLGVDRYEEIPALTRVARQALREKFLRADMGITGVNFAVAETGTIAVVTNEGNGRMCTSVPLVHVAVMGMEKVVPSLEDLGIFLRLLIRAATGQPITSYVTLVTGPRRTGEGQGPREFHLVVLDNGRTRFLQDPDLQEALYCIRCAACLNACPVYRKVGGHAYGWVYGGPIGSVVAPVLVGLPQARELPFASTLCGACREVCPVKIDIPRMLLKLRSRLAQDQERLGERRSPWVERLLLGLWYRVVRSPRLFALANKLGRLVQWPFRRRGVVRRLPPPLSRWTRSRDFPPVAARPFRKRWRGLGEEVGRGG